MITVNIRIDKAIKCNGKNSLFISFPYDYNIVNIMRQQPVRYYNPDTKEWELPVTNFGHLPKQLKDYQLNIVNSNENISNFNFER